jgi:intracellular sulfur oxidation DsrE/DsrF family protein
MKTRTSSTSRRVFINTLAAGATGVIASASAFSNPLIKMPIEISASMSDAEEWMKKIKGKHKIVYDAPEPHNGFPVIWSWVFYQTNNQTGTSDKDLTAMVALRHNAIPLAMEDRLWEKYKFGEMFKINDNNAKAPALRNVFYEPRGADFPVSAMEGIKKLQQRGALFCVCDTALTLFSSFIAQATNQKPEDVKKDWLSGLLPGIQLVPSGVWAVSRAQENGCAYCYAGG